MTPSLPLPLPTQPQPPALTPHDLSVLSKIKDPEASASSPQVIDPVLPRDPNVTDPAVYASVASHERTIIASIQQTELQMAAGLKPAFSDTLRDQYLEAVRQLDELIEVHPTYASARNNRVQALRRVYGDAILVRNSGVKAEVPALSPTPGEETAMQASATMLADLDTAIALLTPGAPYVPISPQAAKTLSQAHTQRGALYHQTVQALGAEGAELRIDGARREGAWGTVEFEEAASRDFMLGGRYGNEVARALAVAANPTAKLCGEMVKEAMRKEFAGALGKSM